MKCPVHGSAAGCYCRWAKGPPPFPRGWGAVLALLPTAIFLGGLGCAALSSVKPTDRAHAYEAVPKTVKAECEAYAFDRASGLVPEVPAMTDLCKRAP